MANLDPIADFFRRAAARRSRTVTGTTYQLCADGEGMTPVEFRQKTDPPTEPGWYWARQHGYERIEPFNVLPYVDRSLVAHRVGVREWCSLNQLDWFGPICEVREG